MNSEQPGTLINNPSQIANGARVWVSNSQTRKRGEKVTWQMATVIRMKRTFAIVRTDAGEERNAIWLGLRLATEVSA